MPLRPFEYSDQSSLPKYECLEPVLTTNWSYFIFSPLEIVTVLSSLLMSVASSKITFTFLKFLNILLIGKAMLAGDKTAVAT